MATKDTPRMLSIGCFGLLMLSLSHLARIQLEAIAYLRKIPPSEAKKIYDRDYTDGDGASLSWQEMSSYCRSTDSSSRLHLWCGMLLASMVGGVGAIVLDQTLG